MALAELLKKRSVVVLGLNSGTSADGLDIATVRINVNRTPYKVTHLRGSFKRFSPQLKKALDQFIQSGGGSIDELIHLDQALGIEFGKLSRSFVNRLARENVTVDLIASHGQTVRHLPGKTRFAGVTVNGTLQLGSLEQIATLTGLPVVGDFRQADIALGNEGAPITVAAMHDICSNPKESRLIVNIGGMANYFYFPHSRSNKKIKAADCGPGNYLSDQLTQHFFAQPFDRNGRLARQGELNDKLLAELSNHPFLRSRRISTGFEEFGANLTEEIIGYAVRHQLQPRDLLATVAAFTARVIARRLKPLFRQDRALTKLYLTGGGVHNSFIKEKLQQELKSVELLSVNDLGLDGDLLEATSYALMGAACLSSRPMPTRFDGQPVRTWPISGRIVQPPTTFMRSKR